MSKHTSGSWSVIDQGEANTMALMQTPVHWLAKVQWNGEITAEGQKANMRLIAAAPDLLAALETLLLEHTQGNRSGAVDMARAAISIATQS
jgi:hypothetical protein